MNSGIENNDLHFDPESPDVEDPQVDPIGPAKAPHTDHDVKKDSRVKGEDKPLYPPYDTGN